MVKNLAKNIKVAVYGSLRKGLHNHPIIKDQKYLGQYETDPLYNLLDLGSFPGLLKNGNTSVIMEVYEVDATCLKRLDTLEGYRGKNESNHYNREKIQSPFGEVYTYFYNGTRSEPFLKENCVDMGDWKDYLETRSVRRLSTSEMC
ncbi:MAG: gamma-glutamylcyclotransferase family protein [Chitinophagaceae bacterium]